MQRAGAEPLAGALGEVLGERGDVAEALAQRRQPDREHVDAVPEILAERAARGPSRRGRGASRRSRGRRPRAARVPPTRSNTPSWSTRSRRTCAASGSSPISSRNSVPPSARSNQPRRCAAAPVKLPRSWPNSSESISSGGIAPQLTRRIGPVARLRPLVDRARDHLLAGAGLAEDQHRRAGRRDLLDRAHHLAQPGVGADDRDADVADLEPRRARPSLSASAASRQLRQLAARVLRGREHRRDRLADRRRAGAARRCGRADDQHAERLALGASGTIHHSSSRAGRRALAAGRARRARPLSGRRCSIAPSPIHASMRVAPVADSSLRGRVGAPRRLRRGGSSRSCRGGAARDRSRARRANSTSSSSSTLPPTRARKQSTSVASEASRHSLVLVSASEGGGRVGLPRDIEGGTGYRGYHEISRIPLYWKCVCLRS